MHYDYAREALYFPQNKPAFEGLSPDLAFDPTERGYSPPNCWWLSNVAHLAYYDEVPLREALGKIGLELLNFYNEGGTQGFLARTSEYGVLAFRGTQPDEFRDTLQDVRIPLVGFAGRGQVHSGFHHALDCVWKQVDEGLEALEAGRTPVWYTGHSLGAALATLAAARRPPAALFTFGSPRVGDSDFQTAVSSLNIHRVVNGADIVTTVPPVSLGYKHVGDLYFLTETASLVRNPSKTAMRRAKARAKWRYAARLPWIRRGWVTARSLVDHAIVNYTAGLWKELH